MDNQHRKISGYRELSQEEIDLVNSVKAQEAALLALVLTVQGRIPYSADMARVAVAEPGRWASIAKTHIQEGASALVRAITQPT